jgi:hypothetical protein
VELQAAAQLLIGKRFAEIGRAGTIAWFAFGTLVPWTNYNGVGGLKSEVALHLQAPWRVVKDGVDLVRRQDIFRPTSARQVGKFEAGGAIGSTAFDNRSVELSNFLAARDLRVLTVVVQPDLSLSVESAGGLCIYVSPVDFGGNEYWRLLHFQQPPQHFVAARPVD